MAGQVWQPAEEGYNQICKLLNEYLLPGVNQALIFQQLEEYSKIPEFNNYLTFILCRAEGQPVEVRQSAGLLLKNNLKTGYNSLQPAFQEYIKSELLPCIGLSDKQLRATVGTVVSTVVQQGTLQAWPYVLQAMVECIDSGDYNHMEGALDALYKVCEEQPHQFDTPIQGVDQRPINVFLPRLLQLFSSQHATLRKLALAIINQFIILLPNALLANMDKFKEGLFGLARDPSGEVRKLVCAALVQILELHPQFLHSDLRSIAEYMLQATQDKDPEVALEACEFWSAFCEAGLPAAELREFLPALVPVLLKNMEYADDDEAVLDAEDLKPRFHQSKVHGAADGVEEEEEDDDDIVNVWNLRKCSAAGLDVLSNVYGMELLPILLPLVQASLQKQADDAWKEREAAVLSMGAVAEGCMEGLVPIFPQIVAYLVPLLGDQRPLVRSITCWTLSRYSKWIVQAVETPEGTAQFDTVLQGLLARILDDSKRVQEAACSAFATLEEEAADELPARLEPILQHLMFAFTKFQPKYLQMMMPPLVEKWQRLADTDKDLFPLLECFTSIAQALGPGFTPYAEPVFVRCTNIIRSHLVAQGDPARAQVAYDKEFIVCALDLLSGLAEGLGPSIESLVARSDLRELLLQCCKDSALDVRQSALALLGDLTKACAVHLQPRVGEFLALAAAQLESQDRESVSLPAEVGPIVGSTVKFLVSILSSPEGVNRSLVENAAITLGRLGLACCDMMAPHMDVFVQPWCYALRTIRDDIEKEDAFRGLCAMVRKNPQGGVPGLVAMCQAICSWNEIHSAELRAEIGHVLQAYKQMLGEGPWQQCMGSLDPAMHQKLSNKYGI
eukprot:jgi/Mesen1/10718/ME000090S10178